MNPNGDDVASQGYKWSYYLLGGSREQLSLWEGLQTSDGTFCSLPSGGGSYVHLYPSEYIAYSGMTASVITKPTSTSSVQEYRIADHLGSNRVVLNGSTGSVVSQSDYTPFGGPLGGSTLDRQSFIDKERDIESQLGNFGVRSYDYDAGRFTSVDPLWEKFTYYTPYHYSHNSPLIRLDPDGKDDYKVDKEGHITLISKTKDDNDVLYATDDEGNIVKSNSLTLGKGLLKKGKTRNVRVMKRAAKYYHLEIVGDEKATELFKFLARNTMVEWAQTMTGKAGKNGKNYITTSHEEFTEKGTAYLIQNELAGKVAIREHRHSHPHNTPIPSGSTDPRSGDLGVADYVYYQGINGKSTIFKIYLPATDEFVVYDKNGSKEEKNESDSEKK